MIVINVELWPRGDSGRRKDLGTIYIANDGTGELNSGNYKARFLGAGGRKLKRSAEVRAFPRQSKGAFHLLRLVLQKAGY